MVAVKYKGEPEIMFQKEATSGFSKLLIVVDVAPPPISKSEIIKSMKHFRTLRHKFGIPKLGQKRALTISYF